MLLRLTLLLLLPLTTLAQRYPIQATVTLTPPYSPYLTDLTAPGAQRLALYLHVTDPTLSDYTCKLRLTIEGVGITLRTRPSFQPIAIPLQGGVPQIFYGEDLIDYFNPNNLDFAGLSRSAFAQTHRLPEGVYRFSIEVLDYNRGTVVSNKATATAWIILNDPPLLNLPRTNTKLSVFDPTNIPFTWTPRHTASPNAAFSTEYVFRLFELPATSREPSATSSQLLSAANQAVLSQLPLYETTLTQSQLVYGPGEPDLIPGRWYAWQVQAIDTEGRDLFKNRGKSEVFVFQFGDPINMPGNVRKETANHQVISIRWDVPTQGDMPEQYRVLYKPTLSDHWYEDVTKERWHNIGYLKPSTTYDIKVRSEKGKQHSEYTAVIQAKTEDESTKFQCGEEGSLRPSIPADALFKLLPGDKIWKRNFTVIVTEAKGSNGYFEGMGWMPTRPLNGIHLRVKFSGQINQDMELFRGKFVTVMDNNPMSNIIDEMEKIGADRRKALLNDSTATQPADSTVVVQTSTTITYTIPGTIDSVYVQNGTIVVIDTEGNETTYEQKDKKTGEMIPITLTDGAGNKVEISKTGEIKQSTTSNTVAGNTTVTKEAKLVAEFLERFEKQITDVIGSSYQPSFPRGAGPMAEIFVVPNCMPEDHEKLGIIKTYSTETRSDESKLQTFLNKIFENTEHKQLITSLANRANSDNKKYEDILTVEERQNIEETLCPYLIEGAKKQYGEIWWRAPLWERAAATLAKHLRKQGLNARVECGTNECKTVAELELSEEVSSTFDITFTHTQSPEKIWEVLDRYGLDALRIKDAVEEDFIEWWWNRMALQDAKIYEREGLSVAIANFVADVVTAPTLYPAISGWVTGKHWRDGHELTGWEQALAALDFLVAEEMVKGCITNFVVRFGNKSLSLLKIPQGTRALASNAIENGYKLNAISETEFVLLSKEGTELAKIIANKFYLIHNGSQIVIDLSKKTTLLGRFAGGTREFLLAKFQKSKLFNLLDIVEWTKPTAPSATTAASEAFKNAAEFWQLFNKKFIDDAIANGDDILLLTKPDDLTNLFYRTSNTGEYLDVSGKVIDVSLTGNLTKDIQILLSKNAFPTMYGREIMYMSQKLGLSIEDLTLRFFK